MSKNTKKGLIIAGLSLDAIVTIFLFVLSIILIVMTLKYDNTGKIENATDIPKLIHYFMKNPTVYLFTGVIPLFILLAVNIVVLVLYVKKSDNKKVMVSDLTTEQKEALKRQIMEELNKK